MTTTKRRRPARHARNITGAASALALVGMVAGFQISAAANEVTPISAVTAPTGNTTAGQSAVPVVLDPASAAPAVPAPEVAAPAVAPAPAPAAAAPAPVVQTAPAPAAAAPVPAPVAAPAAPAPAPAPVAASSGGSGG